MRTRGFVVPSSTAPQSVSVESQSINRQRRESVSNLHLFGNRKQDANQECTNDDENDFSKLHRWPLLRSMQQSATASMLAVAISCAALATPLPSQAATDSGAIVGCLFQKCQLPLLKCIANPKCLANVVCINTCNGREDEIGCQIQCGDLFENEVVGEFNKCVVSDMGCVPKKEDDGLYPVPDSSVLVPKFDTKLWNGKWYITAGQNPLFDVRTNEDATDWASHVLVSYVSVSRLLLLLLFAASSDVSMPSSLFHRNIAGDLLRKVELENRRARRRILHTRCTTGVCARS